MNLFDDPHVMLWITAKADATEYRVELKCSDDLYGCRVLDPECESCAALIKRVKREMEDGRRRYAMHNPELYLARGAELEAAAEFLFPDGVRRLRARPRS